MGQFERLTMGVIIAISAYHFLENSYQRHHFHSLAQEVAGTPYHMQPAYNSHSATAHTKQSELEQPRSSSPQGSHSS
jgi:hypothetical protein